MSIEANQESRSMKTFLIKSLIILVVILGGVGGGIYLGSAFTGKKIGLITPEDLPNSSLLEIGDTFPDYQLRELHSGKVLKISELSEGKSSIIVIVSPTCEPCHTLEAYWNSKVIDKLEPDVQIIVIYDSLEVEVSNFAENSIQIKNSISYSADRFNQGKTERLYSTPTIIGINTNLEIRFISSGFSKEVDAKFVNKYL